MSAIRRALDEGRAIDSREIAYRNAEEGGRTGLLWARRVAIGGTGYSLCFVLDISERKRMEEDLVRARLGADAAARAKSEFLANMSHEIRTPLNGILGLSLLLEEESLPDDLRPMMDLIRTSGEVLRRVLDDVLDYSKIDSGKLELEEEPFDLKACLEWSFELFRKAAAEKNLELRLRFDDGLPARVSGDASRLRQVTANLMSNAVKFTHRARLRSRRNWPGRRLTMAGISSASRFGYRHRHSRGQDRPSLPIVQPGGRFDQPVLRRDGSGSRHLQTSGGNDGRRNPGREPRRQGTTFEFTFSAGFAAGAEPAAEAAGSGDLGRAEGAGGRGQQSEPDGHDADDAEAGLPGRSRVRRCVGNRKRRGE